MKKPKKINEEIMDVSSHPTGGLPGNAFEMVNNYGTYEIQATADTDNQYPAIAQGYNEKIIKHDCENPVNKDKKQSDFK